MSCPGSSQICGAILRQKKMQYDLSSTPLDRCLSTADLSLIAIGCMLGSGVYVLTGEIAGEMAGPGGTVSFIISGLVALLAALCYMECATRLPETGASYLYAYVSFGEIFAFMIGWNAVILRVMSVALVSRGWSAYFDNVLNGVVGNWTVDVVLQGEPWDSPILGKYPDFLAAGIAFLTCVLVAVGTSISARANGFFVSINVVTVIMVFVAGLVYADFETLTEPDGYFPFGVPGVMTGAAACFTGYCGFEAVAFSAEEAKNPSRGLPIAVIVGFIVSMMCYSGVLLALTSMVPYNEIVVESPFVSAFAAVGANWMQYIVAVGALCSMTGCIINCVYCVARCIYALARDGLLPKFLGYTHPVSRTPVPATLFGGSLSVLITIFIDFVSLIQFLSLVAFVEFIIVVASCIMLRYRPQQDTSGYAPLDGGNTVVTEVTPVHNGSIQNGSTPKGYHDSSEGTPLINTNNNGATREVSVIRYHDSAMRRRPGRAVAISLLCFIGFSCGAMYLLTHKTSEISSGNVAYVCSFAVLAALTLFSAIPLLKLPQYNDNIPFKIPLMPYLPLLSLVSNIFLMVQFNSIAFIEFFVWTGIGILVYFCYGIRYSHESPANKHRVSKHVNRAADDEKAETIPINRDFDTSDHGSRRSSADNNAYWAGDSLVSSSETSFAAH
ncbi:cationic amino acid transporter 4-like [Diadema setosum]|uniref:cationic amino acid transporter 4-like n=1 Tax=Diadema setosum TaxID=31175 RepID=UPI003B3A5FF1